MILFFVIFFSSLCFAEDWPDHALRLTGESEKVRVEAIRALRNVSKIETRLKEALSGDKKYLALDAIAALSMDSLLPDLVKSSETDGDGAILLTINVLLNSRNRGRITALYRERLKEGQREKLSVPAQMVMLDTLARTHAILPDEEISSLMQSPFYEVRSATLYYVRHLLKQLKEPRHLRAVEVALGSQPYQIRVQALHLLRELPRPLKAEGRKLLGKCASDSHPEVRRLCESIGKEKS